MEKIPPKKTFKNTAGLQLLWMRRMNVSSVSRGSGCAFLFE